MACKNTQENTSAIKKPNIILILADDAGYADFGFMGSKDILTPNIDALAKDGLLFNDAHVSASVCSPSRAGLLTGRYQQRFGHEVNLEPDTRFAFDPSETTIAEALANHGYYTGIIGKWHLGKEAKQHPLNNGFDYFWGFISGSRSYFYDEKELLNPNSNTLMENHKYTKFNGYLTDALGQKSVEFVEENKTKDKPFFLYLSYNAPHTPMEAKKSVLDKFNGHPRQKLAAMMWSLDEAIGLLTNTLKKEGIYDNTLIYFLSDNGGAHNNQSSNVPLKGWKGNQYEGGTRVPFVMTWKNKIKSGETFDGLVSSLDIYKTSLAAAEISYHENKQLDGRNLLHMIASSSTKGHPDLYWRKDQMASIRNNDFKLIRLNKEKTVLYNIKENLDENLDLSIQYPDTVMLLNQKLLEWEKGLLNPLWLEPDDWNEVTEKIYQDLMNNKIPKVKSPSDLQKINH